VGVIKAAVARGPRHFAAWGTWIARGKSGGKSTPPVSGASAAALGASRSLKSAYRRYHSLGLFLERGVEAAHPARTRQSCNARAKILV